LRPAATPLVRIPVGVVVERHTAASQWIDFTWHATRVLPDELAMKPWTVLREEPGSTAFYAGNTTIDLYRSEAAFYRDNLATENPGLWVVLSPSSGEWPYAIAVVTADPAEGEGFTEAASYLVEQVPMSETIRAVVARFVEENYVARDFVKRKRGRADPEALARRVGNEGNE
jgi:hypothetical protein